MRERRRSSSCASSFCSSNVGSVDIVRPIGTREREGESTSPRPDDHSDHEHVSKFAGGDWKSRATRTITLRHPLIGLAPRSRPQAGCLARSEAARPEAKQEHHGRCIDEEVPTALRRPRGRRCRSRCSPGRGQEDGPGHHHDHDDVRRHVGCTAPSLSQPFLAWGDSNWYALAPGETADNFTGGGWTLTGGAKIVTTTLKDGTTGAVLDLPRGSSATSPTICLTSDFPTARTMVRNVSGSNGGSVGFSVSYAGTSSQNDPVQTGTFKTTGSSGVSGDWALSDPANLDPSTTPGWQLMQITLTANGTKESQVYNLYNDPMQRS